MEQSFFMSEMLAAASKNFDERSAMRVETQETELAASLESRRIDEILATMDEIECLSVIDSPFCEPTRSRAENVSSNESVKVRRAWVSKFSDVLDSFSLNLFLADADDETALLTSEAMAKRKLEIPSDFLQRLSCGMSGKEHRCLKVLSSQKIGRPLMDSLLKSKSDWRRASVVSMKTIRDMTTEELSALFSDPSALVKDALGKTMMAWGRGFPETLLPVAVHSSYWLLRASVGKDDRLTRALRSKLLADDSPAVRASLVMNPGTLSSELRRLSCDVSQDVRMLVAMSGKVDEEMVRRLLRDDSEMVRASLMMNEELDMSQELLADGEFDEQPYPVVLALAKRLSTVLSDDGLGFEKMSDFDGLSSVSELENGRKVLLSRCKRKLSAPEFSVRVQKRLSR